MRPAGPRLLLLGIVLALWPEQLHAQVPHFLRLPFNNAANVIQQGWIYQDDTLHKPQGAIDYINGTRDDSSTWQTFDVVAAADGVAIWDDDPDSDPSNYGNMVLIRHDQTDSLGRHYFTLYAHLQDGTISSRLPKLGRRNRSYQQWVRVKAGEFLGRAGSTGWNRCTDSTRCIHLHFEVNVNAYFQGPTDAYDVYKQRAFYPGQCISFLWLLCPPVASAGPPPEPVSVTSIYPTIRIASLVDQDIVVFGDGFKCFITSGGPCLRVDLTLNDGHTVVPLNAPGQIQRVTPSSFVLKATFGSPGVYSLVVVNPDGGRSQPMPLPVQGQPISVTSALSLFVHNVDDVLRVKMNGTEVGSVNYFGTQTFELFSHLNPGLMNTLELEVENGSIGGWTYGYEITADGTLVTSVSCGHVGTAGGGCRNDDQTRGVVFRQTYTIQRGSVAGVTTPTPHFTMSANGSTAQDGQQLTVPADASGTATVTFTDTSQAGTDPIVGRSWTIAGLGQVSTAAQFSYSLPAGAARAVTLTLSTQGGASPVAVGTVEVTPTAGPQPAQLSYTSFDFPGAAATWASGINDSGQIVGSYRDANGSTHGFLRNGTTFTSIDYPGAVTTQALGINNAGQIVGCYYTFNFPGACYYGFLLSSGTFTPVAFPGAVFANPVGVSDGGDIVGNSLGVPGTAYQLSTGNFTIIQVPGAAVGHTVVSGIDTAGATIVGSYKISANAFDTFGFVRTQGTFSTIVFAGANWTQPTGVNASGEVVGHYFITGNPNVAGGFLLSGGTFRTVAVPGAVASSVGGINNAHQIVGSYALSGGTTRAFLATPEAENGPLTGVVFDNFVGNVVNPSGGYFLFDHFAGIADTDVAGSFVPSNDVRLDRIELPLSLPGNVGTPAIVDVWLMADAGGSPGTILESFSVTFAAPSFSIVSFSSVARPFLSRTVQYWLVASVRTTNPNGTVVHWNLGTSDIGLTSNTVNGSWVSFSGTRPAFRILGSP